MHKYYESICVLWGRMFLCVLYVCLDTPCYYKVSDESQGCLFETVLGDTNGSIWSRYFKQQQKVILVHDRNQRGVLKLEFGRSRTISCCQVCH